MKLWQKDISVLSTIEKFTTGNDRMLDLQMAAYDVYGSIAHTKMLSTIGLLETSEFDQLKNGLIQILEQIQHGSFQIEEGIEDIHSQVELLLTQTLGDMGKKIHSGRSRNDQVLVDLKLFYRAQIQKIVEKASQLFELLQHLSAQYQNVLLPGYTHFQIAMPSSFGLWFGAYAESISEDFELLLAAYKQTNKNPLGSAAGYGSSFPLNRTLTTQLLGFEDLHYNVVMAQMSRGKTEQSIAASIAGLASTLNKLASDATLYMCQNFGFIHFPEELTTGSSIMPHKKNPDVFELIRGKTNLLKALPNTLSMLTTNMPSGYHRDWQLLKDVLFPAFEEVNQCLEMMHLMFSNVRINTSITDSTLYDYLFTVESVNALVLKGIPFRDAYKQIGAAVNQGSYTPQRTVQHVHEGSIGNLMNEEIAQVFQKRKASFQFEKVEAALQALQKL